MHLITCPSCDCAAFSTESHCPHCGGALGAREGLPRSVVALALGLSVGLVGCMKAEDLYGAPATLDSMDSADFDGDGVSAADGDCDDENPDVYPGAEETAGDGVDSNCDGDDDT